MSCTAFVKIPNLTRYGNVRIGNSYAKRMAFTGDFGNVPENRKRY
jgi:hypothetical protein